MNGLEIELHADEPDPYALVVFCDGWCNRLYRAPLALRGDSFSLSFTEPLFDEFGRLAFEHHYRIEGRLAGRSLRVDVQMNGYRWRTKLKRIKARYGLDIALSPDGTGEAPEKAQPSETTAPVARN